MFEKKNQHFLEQSMVKQMYLASDFFQIFNGYFNLDSIQFEPIR